MSTTAFSSPNTSIKKEEFDDSIDSPSTTATLEDDKSKLLSILEKVLLFFLEIFYVKRKSLVGICVESSKNLGSIVEFRIEKLSELWITYILLHF